MRIMVILCFTGSMKGYDRVYDKLYRVLENPYYIYSFFSLRWSTASITHIMHIVKANFIYA